MRKLYIKQKVFKIVDKYFVKDENQNDIYYVEEKFKFFGLEVSMYDMDGNKLFTISRELFNFLPKFNLLLFNGEKIVIQQELKFFKMNFTILSDNYSLYVDGDFLSRDFNIYENNNMIANINRKWFTFGDAFEIEVIDESKEIVILAIMIAIDYLIDLKQKNN